MAGNHLSAGYRITRTLLAQKLISDLGKRTNCLGSINGRRGPLRRAEFRAIVTLVEGFGSWRKHIVANAVEGHSLGLRVISTRVGIASSS